MLEQHNQKEDSRRCHKLIPLDEYTPHSRWSAGNILLRDINDISELIKVDAHRILSALEEVKSNVT